MYIFLTYFDYFSGVILNMGESLQTWGRVDRHQRGEGYPPPRQIEHCRWAPLDPLAPWAPQPPVRPWTWFSSVFRMLVHYTSTLYIVQYTTVAACLEYCCSRGAGTRIERQCNGSAQRAPLASCSGACWIQTVPPHSSSTEWNGPTIHSGASSPSRRRCFSKPPSIGFKRWPCCSVNKVETGERAFSVAAPQAWNRLPVELKTMVDTARFKRELKTLLFSKYLI